MFRFWKEYDTCVFSEVTIGLKYRVAKAVLHSDPRNALAR